MVDRYEHNHAILTEILAIGDKLSYGQLTVDLTWHNGRITKARFLGARKQVYNSDNKQAMIDVAEAISKKIANKSSSDVAYRIQTFKGNVTSIVWESVIEKAYDV